jgi:hypothetical protein
MFSRDFLCPVGIVSPQLRGDLPRELRDELQHRNSTPARITVFIAMSLLANVVGFGAFGFATRCFQLGLQKRFMFDGE